MLYDERYSPIERLVSKGALSSKSGLSTSGSNPGFLSSITPGVEDLTPVRSRSGSKSTSQSRLNSHNFTGNGNGTTSEDEKKQSDKDINTFMWGLWQCENELTFLVDESDVDSFPEGALIVSPQRWRLIKLGGRQIGFHETGIVTAMSKIDPSIPCLNISTATSNCTLVPEELLEQTLDCLSQSLKCPVREYR